MDGRHVADRDAAARREFESAMSNGTAGVSVVTTGGPAGRFGVTVNSVVSVSADPPLLRACIDIESPVAAAVCRNGGFSVNLLAAGQTAVADAFSGPGTHSDLDHVGWYGPADEGPRLEGAAAIFTCRLQAVHTAGTQIVFIGLVTGAEWGETTPRCRGGSNGPH